MNKYTIYCTEDQTRKARKLGAPIEIKTIEEAPKDWQGKAYFTGMATCAKLPTAEQMISWLEEQGFYFRLDTSGCSVEIDFNCIFEKINIPRKEATLSAIDVALEYLTNNNLIK